MSEATEAWQRSFVKAIENYMVWLNASLPVEVSRVRIPTLNQHQAIRSTGTADPIISWADERNQRMNSHQMWLNQLPDAELRRRGLVK